jgi:TPR repeat protein
MINKLVFFSFMAAGVLPRNYLAATKWYELAAVQGHAVSA